MTDEKLAITSSRGFPAWLARQGSSVAFTTYQAGKLFFIGVRDDGERLSIFERTFQRCMGLGVSAGARQLWLASINQMYRFDNTFPQGEAYQGHDALYVPRMSWVTGDLDIHDVAIGPDGRPVFVNTLFNCLATLADGASFRPIWRPPFISKLAAEDRCHLNGVTVDETGPRYVTAVSRSDVSDGWRDNRRDGGFVMGRGNP